MEDELQSIVGLTISGAKVVDSTHLELEFIGGKSAQIYVDTVNTPQGLQRILDIAYYQMPQK